MNDRLPPRSQVHGAARVVGLLLYALLITIAGVLALRSGDTTTADADFEQAGDVLGDVIVEQAATPEPADVAGDTDTDTDGAR